MILSGRCSNDSFNCVVCTLEMVRQKYANLKMQSHVENALQLEMYVVVD